MPAVLTRRTNAERTAETRAKLLEATRESLIELGYAKTSNQEVCRRAGISNGSLLHHFGTRENLMGSTLEYIYRDLTRQVFTRIDRSTRSKGDDVQRLVDALWPVFESRDYKAIVELWVACSQEPVLHARITPYLDEFDDELGPRIAEQLPALGGDPRFLRTMIDVLFSIMEGVGWEKATVGMNGLARFKRTVTSLLRLAFNNPDQIAV